MAHSASSTPSQGRPTGAEEPSVGALVQSAMADVSTLIRSEIELAKAEVGKSAKKAGIGVGAFGAAGVLLGVSTVFLFITIAEFLTWLGLQRWISYLIVWALFLLLAGIAALVGRRTLKKIEKPERTLETLRELPEVVHREAPGERRREVPTVSNGRVQLRGSDQYSV
ncbi:phage holin family protein [Geodermatophilus sabuli]|uniref:Putative Holin-X, holin superfamily III n=1 Tax=Geodermatophilus sabuli TaxID=1564158 RepID=A0A285ED58_9ACTN|nr:phage holin family protein [Geodermatophilus sabuli]MBB3083506.1 membrane protein implicated in regulation of membrane protease activity [Geodermatophilus sabuli]SNX96773.1 Putative Holin-X, holin superfamily III [Geodermatophilus sabuli]